jgi:hypothetical protein
MKIKALAMRQRAEGDKGLREVNPPTKKPPEPAAF